MQPMSAMLLEQFVFSKPYFDPAGLIVALRDDKPVGFVHAGFGPNDEGTALATELGHHVSADARKRHAQRSTSPTSCSRGARRICAIAGRRCSTAAASGRSTRFTSDSTAAASCRACSTPTPCIGEACRRRGYRAIDRVVIMRREPGRLPRRGDARSGGSCAARWPAARVTARRRPIGGKPARPARSSGSISTCRRLDTSAVAWARFRSGTSSRSRPAGASRPPACSIWKSQPEARRKGIAIVPLGRSLQSAQEPRHRRRRGANDARQHAGPGDVQQARLRNDRLRRSLSQRRLASRPVSSNSGDRCYALLCWRSALSVTMILGQRPLRLDVLRGQSLGEWSGLALFAQVERDTRSTARAAPASSCSRK